MTDQQCFTCQGIWNCKDRFKGSKDSCERHERAWGTCRKCSRIVSPRHSNCPRCGNTDIKPACEDLVLEVMKETKKE